jgi:hypothetical protein
MPRVEAKGMLVIVSLMASSGLAAANIPVRTFTTVGGSRYIESEDVVSCGKESRDLLKKTAQAARSITVTAKTIRMNDGEPMDIDRRESDTISGMRVIDNPTPAFPDRKSALILTVTRVENGDYFFSVARLVVSGDSSCADTYARSLD